jgi:hypothetical protein
MILREDPGTFAHLSPDEIQRIIQKYQNWRDSLTRAGRSASGQKLRDDGGRVMRGAGGAVSVTDGPFSEAKEVIGGFFTIEARDYDDAVRVSCDCPHLAYGGSIELREVEPT